MEYQAISKGKFIERPNRFVAVVELDGKPGGGKRCQRAVERVHVKNTGRCRELLVPGATVYLEDYAGRMGKRKMRYSLVAVEKGRLLINMDAQAPNQVVREALAAGRLPLPGMGPLRLVQGEKAFGASRLDFYVEDQAGQRGFIEVKGVTLEEKGVARFPDAPTERGVRHLEELIRAKDAGYFACVLFVVQMAGMTCFRPNDETHPAFGAALRKAAAKGVLVMARECAVTENSLTLAGPVPAELQE